MSTTQPREQFLLISAHGANAMELTSVINKAAQESRCAIISSRLGRHGEFSALTAQASGSWDALARLEGLLPTLAKRHELSVNVTRSASATSRPQALPYVVYVSAAYRPDIVSELCQFFTDHHLELESLTCDTYLAPHTGTTMLNANITVTLPAGTQISWLRDQFLDFADAMNLDALIEPWRPQNP
ncbi:glycine cleavage system transcriptional repressor [Pseudomonas fluvialis]|jgi:glycine cleavage system transcriptional repressor|uniref:Glycine cleavage system transcriptional repressor n=1 Tax=Pseudomonas fluvialis TaxID=1793966 RepID=A0A7X0BVU9_9PSED|nr:glycine cleavage system protein R [Pseudomonas fluvialis]MBB6342059.1 glycine cleavage system transcriptional repressor [Pseudomonas fluvialis]